MQNIVLLLTLPHSSLISDLKKNDMLDHLFEDLGTYRVITKHIPDYKTVSRKNHWSQPLLCNVKHFSLHCPIFNVLFYCQ